MSKLSITRVMASLKSLDTRLNSAINSGPFVGLTRGTIEPELIGTTHSTAALFSNAATANYNSILKLMDNRNKLRAALTQSNATVKVTINGVERSIAETLEYRRSVVPVMTSFITLLKGQLHTATTKKEMLDKQLEEQIERQSATLKNDAGKTDPGFLTALRTQIESTTKPMMLDPLGLSNIIDKHQKELDNFLLEVDYVLSEVNATTTIEVDLAG